MPSPGPRIRLFLVLGAVSAGPLLLMALPGLIPLQWLWLLLPIFVVDYAVAAALARPLEELLTTATNMRAGDLKAHALVAPESELAPVAAALHGFAAELEQIKRHLEDRVRERTEALTRKADQLRAVGQVGQQVAAVLEPESLLHFVVRIMRGTFGYDLVAALRRQGDHLILAAARLMFGVHAPYNIPATIVTLVICALTSLSMGLAMGAAFRSVEATIPVTIVLFFLLAMFGGAVMPLDGAPEFMLGLQRAMPSMYMTRALRQTMMQGNGLSSILEELAILATCLLAFGGLALWRIRRQVTAN